jgi:hypothetical protein
MRSLNEGGLALGELRAARRRRRLSGLDVFEGIYRVYLTAIAGTMAVLLLAGATGDRKLAPAGLAAVRDHGAAALGLVIAAAIAIGLRSGGRGGPLVVEAADVAHLLLAPVDRGAVLRGPLIRQLRFLLLTGAATGGVAGLLAARRIPGGRIAWVASGGAAAGTTVLLAFGAAVIVSGLRASRWVAGGLALAVSGWSAFDLATRSISAPGSLLGALALWPLTLRPLALAGVALALLVPVAGLAVVGGTSLEAMQRRASLVGQLRFAVTLQDLRTVIVLRRQLAQEAPRGRPWLRLPRAIPPAWLWPEASRPAATGDGGPDRAHVRHLPVWRRGWHGVLRWPALRWARLAVLGALAGAALTGAWRGTTPLVMVAGVALFVAALDAVEPLAQEIDHPDRSSALPVPAGRLHLRQLGAGAVVMLAVAGVGVGVAAALTGADPGVLATASVAAVTGALAATGGAAVSVIKGPPPPAATQSLVPPEIAGARAMFRLIWPPAIAVLGVLPVLAGRAAHRRGLPLAPSLAGAAQGEILLVLMVLAWVRFQAEAHLWWDVQMSAARPAPRSGPRPSGQ